ncbi:beta-1,3-galactosyltransferase 1-like [Clytia hemisphaerica]|uniref:beta-1,3-galactosyltransferase 1-like n=1 Tax=Clytia hemisphaerica TaxID=252671 RepID=UPI0034D562DE
MPRMLKMQLVLFFMYFFLVLLLAIIIYTERCRSETLSTKFDAFQSKFDELQTDFMKVHRIVKPNPNRKPNIRLLNPKDIEPFHGDILILVTSHIEHGDRRNAIRFTWGDTTKFNNHSRKYDYTTYKSYFVTGYKENILIKAKLESSIYRDLLITNRTENYWDLSRRLIFGFLWSLESCSYNYLLKTDDDVFVNIPNLLAFVNKDPFVLKHKDRIFAGFIWAKNGPIRDPSSKWYVSKEEWGPDYYPFFATGMANILSRLVVEKIRPYFEWENPFRLDDVYIGMLISWAKIPGIGIRISEKKTEFSGFNPGKECNFINSAITYHKVISKSCMEKFTRKSMQQSN